ncbi:MAG: hypothetical protein DRG59_01045 [Deltaproteobacteria bacterium]|nr:MAG: hypothetical protein DRG59_01045 [Deltaproteobacteria bacterium]
MKVQGIEGGLEETIKQELDEEDKIHISEIFHREIVPKLRRLDGRIGNVNCSFAGEKYKNWNIVFRSEKSGYEIVDFEYDENSSSINLDL